MINKKPSTFYVRTQPYVRTSTLYIIVCRYSYIIHKKRIYIYIIYTNVRVAITSSGQTRVRSWWFFKSFSCKHDRFDVLKRSQGITVLSLPVYYILHLRIVGSHKRICVCVCVYMTHGLGPPRRTHEIATAIGGTHYSTVLYQTFGILWYRSQYV